MKLPARLKTIFGFFFVLILLFELLSVFASLLLTVWNAKSAEALVLSL